VKEAAIPLLSLPDYKAQRHNTILRGTGLSPAQEVSFFSAFQCAKPFGDPVVRVSQVLSSWGGQEKLVCETNS